MLKIITWLIIIVFVSAARAEDNWSEWATIQELYPTANSLNFWASTTSLFSTCEGNRFSLNQNNPDYNVQVSVLIAAFMANKEIKMFIIQTPLCAAQIDRFRVR